MTNEENEQRIAEIERRIAADHVGSIYEEEAYFRYAAEFLVEQLRAARLDSARLDWLEGAIAEGNVPEFVENEYVDHHLAMPAGFQIGSVGGTNLRAAIDAAQNQ